MTDWLFGIFVYLCGVEVKKEIGLMTRNYFSIINN